MRYGIIPQRIPLRWRVGWLVLLLAVGLVLAQSPDENRIPWSARLTDGTVLVQLEPGSNRRLQGAALRLGDEDIELAIVPEQWLVLDASANVLNTAPAIQEAVENYVEQYGAALGLLLVTDGIETYQPGLDGLSVADGLRTYSAQASETACVLDALNALPEFDNDIAQPRALLVLGELTQQVGCEQTDAVSADRPLDIVLLSMDEPELLINLARQSGGSLQRAGLRSLNAAVAAVFAEWETPRLLLRGTQTGLADGDGLLTLTYADGSTETLNVAFTAMEPLTNAAALQATRTQASVIARQETDIAQTAVSAQQAATNTQVAALARQETANAQASATAIAQQETANAQASATAIAQQETANAQASTTAIAQQETANAQATVDARASTDAQQVLDANATGTQSALNQAASVTASVPTATATPTATETGTITATPSATEPPPGTATDTAAATQPPAPTAERTAAAVSPGDGQAQETEGTPPPSGISNTAIILLGGLASIAVVLLVVLILLLTSRRGSRRAPSAAGQAPANPSPPAPEDFYDLHGTQVVNVNPTPPDLELSEIHRPPDETPELDQTEIVSVEDVLGSVGQVHAWLRNTESGQHYEVRTPDTLLGRSPDCDIVIPEDRQISREHVRFVVRDDGSLWLYVLTRNPIMLNGELVTSEAELTTGDTLRLSAHLTVLVEEPPGAEPT